MVILIQPGTRMQTLMRYSNEDFKLMTIMNIVLLKEALLATKFVAYDDRNYKCVDLS